ncbi:hypothetical protein TrLO_g7462 [Triparma laevis f. longispina]|uniref:Uncharacterized protein n=1 Tax=Triparma laevis f. longispina TaxID=1714387 RepID=A0A9W6ZH25_9STRA|nr:hypothetical protein TrLO_g7462 [Triparma laevis f. longispina]
MLLAWTGGYLLPVAVFAGELSLYFAYKICRGDMYYWGPVQGCMGLSLAIICRTVLEVATDWSCVCQFRHQKGVRGAWSCLTMMFTVGIGLTSALTFTGTGNDFVEVRNVVLVMIGCCAGICLSFGLFLMNIDSAYVRTFFDVRTGKQFLQEAFKNLNDENQKFNIFLSNEKI